MMRLARSETAAVFGRRRVGILGANRGVEIQIRVNYSIYCHKTSSMWAREKDEVRPAWRDQRVGTSSCAAHRGRPKRSSASARGGPSTGWSRSSSSTRRGRVDRRRSCARSSASPASTATRSRTSRASILRSVSFSFKLRRRSTQMLLSEQRCDDMNESDATPRAGRARGGRKTVMTRAKR